VTKLSDAIIHGGARQTRNLWRTASIFLFPQRDFLFEPYRTTVRPIKITPQPEHDQMRELGNSVKVYSSCNILQISEDDPCKDSLSVGVSFHNISDSPPAFPG
jgi:hypothetical protein